MHTDDADKSKAAKFTPADLTTPGSEKASSYTEAEHAYAAKTTGDSDVGNMDNFKQLKKSPSSASDNQTLISFFK